MGKGAAAAITRSTSLVLIAMVMLLMFSVSFPAVQGVPAETGKPAVPAVNKNTEPHAGAKKPQRKAITKETEEAELARLIASANEVLEKVNGHNNAVPRDLPKQAPATKATQVKESNTEGWKGDGPKPQGMAVMSKIAPKIPRA
ncbi:hypothetical protein ACP4OV_018247 [Aristida adscensionis]